MKYVVIKVGDLPQATGFKDGMVVTVLDASEPLSDHMKRVFAIVCIDDKDPIMVEVEAALLPQDEDDPKGLPRSNVLKLADLADLCGDASLEAAWRSTDVVDPSTPGSLDKLKFELASQDQIEQPDLNVVTSGSFTVGTAGNYANWTTAAADTGNLTGNLTFTMISSFTEATVPSFTPNLNGFTLKLTTASPHNGDPTTGYQWTYNGASFGLTFTPSAMTGGGVFEVGGFRINQTAFRNDPSRGPLRLSGGVHSFTAKYHDLIADFAGFRARGISTTGAGPVILIWNVILADGRPNTFNNGGEAMPLGGGAAGSRVENCAVHGFREGILAGFGPGVNWTVKNCVSFGHTNFNGTPGTAYDDGSDNLAVGITNVADDTTAVFGGSGSRDNINSVVISPQFVSLVKTNVNYLKLVDPPLTPYSLGRLGDNPNIADNIAGIRPAVARPGIDARTSIGPDENNTVTGPGATHSFGIIVTTPG